MCYAWRHDFQAFLNDMGLRPGKNFSLDRIDNDGGYEPGNCRWTTQTVQSRNRRTNSLITHNGETKCAEDWAKELGIARTVIQYRQARGQPIDGKDKRNAKYIVVDGLRDSITNHSKARGMNPRTIKQRVAAGWPTEHLFIPPDKTNRVLEKRYPRA